MKCSQCGYDDGRPEAHENLRKLQYELGETINIMAGLYEGKMSSETYPIGSQEARAGALLRRLVHLIVKEQPR